MNKNKPKQVSENEQLSEMDMKMRESGLMQKMMKRMDTLEVQLKDVQLQLSGAAKIIAEKDKELERLKSQVFEDNNKKHNQPQSEESFSQISLENVDINVNGHSKALFDGTNSKKKAAPFDVNTENMGFERRLSETIEQRIKRVKALNPEVHSNNFKTNINNEENDWKNENSPGEVKNISDSEIMSGESYDSNKEVEDEYVRMVAQIEEMEKFLGDYGLIWVGDVKVPTEDNRENRIQATVGFTPNFDKVIMVIGGLNERSSAESQVEVSEKMGRFKKTEVLQLVIYADGIKLEDNPFREYSSESVQEFFQDLEDGYYPTELKDSYPDGVIFRVIDKRNINYADESKNEGRTHFPGKGHRLGGQEVPVMASEKRNQTSTQPEEKIVDKNLYSDKNKEAAGGNLKSKGREKTARENLKSEGGKEAAGENLKSKGGEEAADKNLKSKGGKEASYELKENLNVQASIPSKETSATFEVIEPEDIKNKQDIQDSEVVVDGTTNVMKEETVLKEGSNISTKSNTKAGSIKFRDYINITNITYNEAPVEIHDPTPHLLNQTGQRKNERYNEASATYADPPPYLANQREQMQNARYKEGPTIYHDTALNLGNQREQPELQSRGYPQNLRQALPELSENTQPPEFHWTQTPDNNDFYGPKRGSESKVSGKKRKPSISEYMEKINDNAKFIEDSIKQNMASKVGKGAAFNKHEKFDHITIIVPKSQQDSEGVMAEDNLDE